MSDIKLGQLVQIVNANSHIWNLKIGEVYHINSYHDPSTRRVTLQYGILFLPGEIKGPGPTGVTYWDKNYVKPISIKKDSISKKVLDVCQI